MDAFLTGAIFFICITFILLQNLEVETHFIILTNWAVVLLPTYRGIRKLFGYWKLSDLKPKTNTISSWTQ